MRALLVILFFFVACAPPTTISKVQLPVASVEVVVTGRCTGTPCDRSVFDQHPLIAPSSSFEASVFRNAAGEPVVTLCDTHAVGLGHYRVSRLNDDGGTEVRDVWAGALSLDTSYEINTQHGPFGNGDEFNTFNSLYGLRTDGSQDFEDGVLYPHDLDPVSNDGGVLVFEYKPDRVIDPDGGFLPSVRQELPFTFTETHRVSMTVETVEEHFSECPRTPGPPYKSTGWY